MQTLNHINTLIERLTDLKPQLSQDPSVNASKFIEVLNSALKSSHDDVSQNNEALRPENNIAGNIPSWVDSDFSYDPSNPRKPNMRELMEAMAGCSVEELYSSPVSNWQELAFCASEILYGVVGNSLDTRDWNNIMESQNVLQAARKQTSLLHEPKLEIIFQTDNISGDVKQVPVIKDKNGILLRGLSEIVRKAEEDLLNFGVTKKSIPSNLSEIITDPTFNNDLLSLLENYSGDANHPNSVVLENSIKAL